MFKHILLATDGSPASEAAARSAIALAAETGASITAVHVLPDSHVFSYAPEIEDQARELFMRDGAAHAAKVLAAVTDEAGARGVGCDSVLVRGDRPFRKILELAQERHCDLIAMASHGQLGLQGVLLGSETHKVLVHSPVPVLVFRGE